MGLILASASPRRQELLQRITKDFDVIPAVVNETCDQFLSPEHYVLSMAERKAQAIYKLYPNDIVIGCDTIVVLNGEILRKPESKETAYAMLKALSGQVHQVCTSVFIIGEEQIAQEIITANVTFYELTDEEISTYLETGEYCDKAGAYGIQGQGALLIEKINGDFYAVVGFPISSVARMLQSFGGVQKK